MNEEQFKLNQRALRDPQPGDYWHEMFCPYFMVVQCVDRKITVLSCLGGAASSNRKHEPNARINNYDGTWEFDYSKSMIVDLDWIEEAVTYRTIKGFCADVVNNEKTQKVVNEYIEYKTKELLKELENLGPLATKYLLGR
jgi:hypothetical protein